MAGAKRRTIKWTPELDQKMLRIMEKTRSLTSTAVILGLDRKSIRNRLEKLDRADMESSRKPWSEKEDQRLTDLYCGRRMSRPDIAEKMQRTLFSVVNRINVLALTRMETPARSPMAVAKMTTDSMRLDRRLIVSEVRAHIRATGNHRLRSGLIKAIQKWPIDRWSKISNEPVMKIMKKMEAL